MDSLKDAQDQTSSREIVSPSLIKSPPSDVNWSDYKNFDLGVDLGWQWQTDQQCVENVPTEVEQEVEPDIKKPRLSLSLKKAASAQ